MTKTISIIAHCQKSLTVWNAIKLHVEYLLDANYEIVVYAFDDVVYRRALNDLPKCRIIYCSNWLIFAIRLKKNAPCHYTWCPDIYSVLTCKLLSYLMKFRILFWVQGLVAEESYMRNCSRIRYVLLILFELLAFRVSDALIFVSESMAHYYGEKRIISSARTTIIPCASDLSHSRPSKRIPNSFIYIGGLSSWQCIEDTFRIFKTFSKLLHNSIFHFVTRDVDNAKAIASKYLCSDDNVCIYSIEDRNLLPDILSRFEYGFLLRKKHLVNYVSSPIKFAEYLSCGVNVIMTNAIPHYANAIMKHKVGIVLRDDLTITEVVFSPSQKNAISLSKDMFDRSIMTNRYRDLLKSFN